MTQPELVINELKRRKGLFGLKSWLTIGEVERMVGINSAYSVMAIVTSKVKCLEDWHDDMRSNKRWKIWRIK